MDGRSDVLFPNKPHGNCTLYMSEILRVGISKTVLADSKNTDRMAYLFDIGEYLNRLIIDACVEARYSGISPREIPGETMGFID